MRLDVAHTDRFMNSAQDLARIAEQENTLVLERFDADVAWRIGSRLRELAAARRATVAIDVRRFGQMMFFNALSGATADNAEWIRRKSNVVQRFLRSSYGVALEVRAEGVSLTEKYALAHADHAAAGGGFPLHVAGAGVIGSVAVSGLPERDDHELVVEVLCELCSQDYRRLALPKTGS